MFDDPVAVFVTGAAILVALFVSLGGLGGSKSKDEKVYPIILGFATGNPPYKVSQQTAADIAEKAPAVQQVKPLIQRIYGNGKIA